MIVIVGEDRGHAAPLEQELVTTPRGVVVVGAFEMPVADDLARRRLETLVESAAGQPPVPQRDVLGKFVQRQSFGARLSHVRLAATHATFARHSHRPRPRRSRRCRRRRRGYSGRYPPHGTRARYTPPLHLHTQPALHGSVFADIRRAEAAPTQPGTPKRLPGR